MGDFTVPSSWVGKSKALRFRTSTIDQSGVGPPMSSRCGLALAHIHGRAISSIRAHSTEGTPVVELSSWDVHEHHELASVTTGCV
jgi:hypothetical protein